jgi:hypothetical protein
MFLGWVEMHGLKDADFWGWGAHAPTTNRVITTRAVKNFSASAASAKFTVENDWLAESQVMVRETVEVSLKETKGVHCLDLHFTFHVPTNTILSKWAFSGFCARAMKYSPFEVTSALGKVDFPPPHHMKPETDWPDHQWYDFTSTLKSGEKVGLTVMNSPRNPVTLWHNLRELGMINPCIVAAHPVTIRPETPLELRYRIVAHDGPAPVSVLHELSRELIAPK